MEGNATFENSEMMGWQIIYIECGTIWQTKHNLKIHKWLEDNATFENSEMIGWQVNCNECGNIWQKTHTLKIHKYLNDKLLAMNV